MVIVLIFDWSGYPVHIGLRPPRCGGFSKRLITVPMSLPGGNAVRVGVGGDDESFRRVEPGGVAL